MYIRVPGRRNWHQPIQHGAYALCVMETFFAGAQERQCFVRASHGSYAELIVQIRVACGETISSWRIQKACLNLLTDQGLVQRTTVLESPYELIAVTDSGRAALIDWEGECVGFAIIACCSEFAPRTRCVREFCEQKPAWLWRERLERWDYAHVFLSEGQLCACCIIEEEGKRSYEPVYACYQKWEQQRFLREK